MAIFSLIHGSFGKSPRGKSYSRGGAAAHANYITRESTCTRLLTGRAPEDRQELKSWLHSEEISDRKNARVIDKVMVALPIELDHEQRAELLRGYCEAMTKGRASWAAAIHDGPGEVNEKGQYNPHAHIIFRDRDHETGQRVMFTSASPGEAAKLRARGEEVVNTAAFRKEWAEHCNEALELAGHESRIDHRTLREQGIDRERDRHHGPDLPAERVAGIARENAIEITAPATSAEIEAPEPARVSLRDRVAAFYAQREAPGLAQIEHDQPAPEAGREARRSAAPIDEGMDWTGRAGMVAQQMAALEEFIARQARLEARSAEELHALRPDYPADIAPVDQWPGDRAREQSPAPIGTSGPTSSQLFGNVGEHHARAAEVQQAAELQEFTDRQARYEADRAAALQAQHAQRPAETTDRAAEKTDRKQATGRDEIDDAMAAWIERRSSGEHDTGHEIDDDHGLDL